MPVALKSGADLQTAPFDPRFPNQNQTRMSVQVAVSKMVKFIHRQYHLAKQDAVPAIYSFYIFLTPKNMQFYSAFINWYCYQSYLDFHRCQKVRGTSYEPCQYFKRVYQSMCPHAWVEKWDGQRDDGTFPGRI